MTIKSPAQTSSTTAPVVDPSRIAATQIHRAAAMLDEYGYVVVEGLLDEQRDLVPVKAEYSALLDRLAGQWVVDGTLSSYPVEACLDDRMHHVIRETGSVCHQALDVTLPLVDIQIDTPMHHGPAVFSLLRNANLLDVVETVVGPELFSAPVQHVRIKVPESEVPDSQRTALTAKSFWHQNTGVIDPEADDTNYLGAFLAISEVTEENGCVVVVPRSHRQGLVHHCRSKHANGIPESAIGEPRIPIIMQAGDVLFLHTHTIHASLPNTSDSIRWSFDIRYCPVGAATGRPWFPGFVARSRANPSSELRDADSWAASWRRVRAALAGTVLPRFARWDSSDPARACPTCAEPA